MALSVQILAVCGRPGPARPSVAVAVVADRGGYLPATGAAADCPADVGSCRMASMSL
jgi:hypothetical protein